MKIGVPTEIKSQENRVAITPAGVHHLTQRGHQVLVQAGAGHRLRDLRRRLPHRRRDDRRRRLRTSGARPTCC